MLSNIQHNQGNSHWQKEEREQNFAFLLWVLGFVGVLNYHLSNFDPTLPLGHLAEKKKFKRESIVLFGVKHSRHFWLLSEKLAVAHLVCQSPESILRK